MKNITVSVDDDTYRMARIRAAERETSVSALVKSYLLQIACGGTGETEFQRLEREERELRDELRSQRLGFSAPRDDTARASCGNGPKAISYHFIIKVLETWRTLGH